MNKKTILIFLTISLFVLSGCNINDFQENYSFYKNKEENERKITELKKDMDRNKKEVKIVLDTYKINRNAAEAVGAEIIEYLSNNQVHGYDINNNNIYEEAFLEYNMIVLKTHLISYAENHIDNTLSDEVSISEKNQAIEKFKDEFIESAEIKYFPDFDKGQLEQVVIYKLDNGLINMFSMLWEFQNLIDTDFIEIQEFEI